MAYIEIPLRKDIFDYTEQVTLDGTVYILRLRYNARMDRWLMDIQDASGEDLATGIPLLCGVPLTYKWIGRTEGLPPGQFLMVDKTGQDRSPTKDDLGDDLKLVYSENT